MLCSERIFSMELVRPMGKGGKGLTSGSWDLRKSLACLGFCGGCFWPRMAEALYSSYHTQNFMGQVRLTGILVSICSRPPTWAVGFCTGATLTFSVSGVIAQCWSTWKEMLRCPLGNRSTHKEAWGLCCAYICDGWKCWAYDKDCSQELLTVLFYSVNGQCVRQQSLLQIMVMLMSMCLCSPYC